MAKVKYESDIVLGERYRDEQTGYEGVATAIYFFQHACERVLIERINPHNRSIEEQSFDAPRLINVITLAQAQASRPGGPVREVGTRPEGARR